MRLPKLTVYAKIIYLLMVVISGALCTIEDYVIMSQCAHNKAIHIAGDGTVSVTDISQTQNITIVGLPDYLNNNFKIALHAKETQRYLCFNENWRLVGMKQLKNTCYFNETIVHGYFVFHSVVDVHRRVGFTHRGKAIGPKKSGNDACYLFTKIPADLYFHEHNIHHMSTKATSPAMPPTKPTLLLPVSSPSLPLSSSSSSFISIAKSHISNRSKVAQVNRTHHASTGTNAGADVKRNDYDPVATNRSHGRIQQPDKTHTETRTTLSHHRQLNNTYVVQHQKVRHHHNDPNLIARRQQHDRKQKRRQRNRHNVTVASHSQKTNTRATIKSIALRKDKQIQPTRLAVSELLPFPIDLNTSLTLATVGTVQTSRTITKTTTTATASDNPKGPTVVTELYNFPFNTTEMPTIKRVMKLPKRRRKVRGPKKRTGPHSLNQDHPSLPSDGNVLHKWWTLSTPPSSASSSSTTSSETSTSYEAIGNSTTLASNFYDEETFNYTRTVFDNELNHTNSDELTLVEQFYEDLSNMTTPDVNMKQEDLRFWLDAGGNESAAADIETTVVPKDGGSQMSSSSQSWALTDLTVVPESSTVSMHHSSIAHSLFETMENSTTLSTPTLNRNNKTNNRALNNLEHITILLPTLNNLSSEYTQTQERPYENFSPSTSPSTVVGLDNDKKVNRFEPKIQDYSTKRLETTIVIKITPPSAAHMQFNKKATGNCKFLENNELSHTKELKVLVDEPQERSKQVIELQDRLHRSDNFLFAGKSALDNSLRSNYSTDRLDPSVRLILTTPDGRKESAGEATIPTTSMTPKAKVTPTATMATRKHLRKITQILHATPFHHLTYMRNSEKDVDVGNIDNINLYSDLDINEDELNDPLDSHANVKHHSAPGHNSNSRLTVINGYLPTASTSILPESIRIAKIKINNERKRLYRRNLQLGSEFT